MAIDRAYWTESELPETVYFDKAEVNTLNGEFDVLPFTHHMNKAQLKEDLRCNVRTFYPETEVEAVFYDSNIQCNIVPDEYLIKSTALIVDAMGNREEDDPVQRLQHRLHGYVNYTVSQKHEFENVGPRFPRHQFKQITVNITPEEAKLPDGWTDNEVKALIIKAAVYPVLRSLEFCFMGHSLPQTTINVSGAFENNLNLTLQASDIELSKEEIGDIIDDRLDSVRFVIPE
ncbi:hypothetical protein [Neptuniibacter sp. QD37_11]|uniref:hypothetical protein n=1 Tax=Neptuniibacter sp. QD37_11 TaxID=3398209 RepID=UPI0039F453C0